MQKGHKYNQPRTHSTYAVYLKEQTQMLMRFMRCAGFPHDAEALQQETDSLIRHGIASGEGGIKVASCPSQLFCFSACQEIIQPGFHSGTEVGSRQ